VSAGVPALLTGLLVVGVVCTVAAARASRDVRLPLVATLFLAPVAVSLWIPVAGGRVAFAAAGVVSVPALLVADRRHGETLRGTLAPLARHPFAPFAVLYAAAAAFGVCWGIARGNDPLLCAGQGWTAALFLIGFCWAAPRLGSLATPRFWLLFLAGVAALSLRGLVYYTVALAEHPTNFVRFLPKTDFYAFTGVVIALGVLAPRRPAVKVAAAAAFGLLTVASFTRSYWLGAAVGCVLLALLAARHPPRLSRPRPLTVAAGAAVLALTAAALALSPLGGFAIDRVSMTQRDSVDISVDVRSLELDAALRQIARTPITGVGSGGEFTAVHQTSGSTVAYGPTNFVHSAYVYFPLKYGVLGFAAVIGLVLGLLRCVRRAVSRRRARSIADLTWLAVLAAILAASATAPNLVDPIYSLFCGAIAGLAGLALQDDPVPAPAPEPPSAPDVPDQQPSPVAAAWA
jgi:hypothetical protein